MTEERLKEWEMAIKESFLFYLAPRHESEKPPETPCALFKKMMEEAGVHIGET